MRSEKLMDNESKFRRKTRVALFSDDDVMRQGRKREEGEKVLYWIS